MTHPKDDILPDQHGINRRSFLRYGATAGAGAAALAAGGRPLTASRAKSADRERLRQVPPFELEEATIAELQSMLDSGEHTARSLTQAYLGRIEALDRQGPALRHVIETNPDAINIAERMDRERRERDSRGPLHGIPVIIKDNIDTADRMMTTAGSLALEGAPAPRDSGVAERLRAAGAIIMAKANLSEWANFRGSQSSSGWSARGGQGRNPYALDRSPCGSSSGTGGGISASYAAVGVGTETDGSVVCPSAANSLVGIKPTLGLISRAGIVPIAHSQDTAGPMARTVTDAAILLGALAGEDPRDTATAASRGHRRSDYTEFLVPDGLEGARIGVARDRFFGYSPEADRIVENAIDALRDAGATIIDPADIPHVRDYGGSEFSVLLYEFKHDLNSYLATRVGVPVRSMADVIAFNEEHAALELAYFGQETMLAAVEKGPLTEKEYLDALARNHRLSREEGIDAVMGEHELDAIVAPTDGPPWTIDLINGDHFLGASSQPAAVSGYPSITVPAGYSFGLPVGLSFIGAAWSEPVLVRLAYSFEQATGVRRPPRFRPHVALPTA